MGRAGSGPAPGGPAARRFGALRPFESDQARRLHPAVNRQPGAACPERELAALKAVCAAPTGGSDWPINLIAVTGGAVKRGNEDISAPRREPPPIGGMARRGECRRGFFALSRGRTPAIVRVSHEHPLPNQPSQPHSPWRSGRKTDVGTSLRGSNCARSGQEENRTAIFGRLRLRSSW